MHLLVILVVAMLVFGPKRLGEIGKGLGQGVKAFKSGLSDEKPESKPANQDSKTS